MHLWTTSPKRFQITLLNITKSVHHWVFNQRSRVEASKFNKRCYNISRLAVFLIERFGNLCYYKTHRTTKNAQEAGLKCVVSWGVHSFCFRDEKLCGNLRPKLISKTFHKHSLKCKAKMKAFFGTRRQTQKNQDVTQIKHNLFVMKIYKIFMCIM